MSETKKYGYQKKADDFLKAARIRTERTMSDSPDFPVITMPKLHSLIALAMAKGRYGDKVLYVDGDGRARGRDGRHL